MGAIPAGADPSARSQAVAAAALAATIVPPCTLGPMVHTGSMTPR
ncbi:Uncharacterised protein [Mycobacteroides abscessus subsp. abscessus]|nr:Uncharacterised protein [Mycobacteroides abscessus subsp. abscessus]